MVEYHNGGKIEACPDHIYDCDGRERWQPYGTITTYYGNCEVTTWFDHEEHYAEYDQALAQTLSRGRTLLDNLEEEQNL